MTEMQHQNRPFSCRPPSFTGLLLLCLLLTTGFACAQQAEPDSTAEAKANELVLDERSGDAPHAPNRVPHQQLDQNSPPEILKKLKSFLFSLEHVEEKRSRSSFPSARGANIKSGVSMNSKINREFTHIHMEPGPGSQHLALTEKDFQLVSEKGWGIKHPWSESSMEDGLVLLMVYAPRNEEDLDNIKKIITAAWHLALSEDK